MRILQPAEWSKPRGFSHGVVARRSRPMDRACRPDRRRREGRLCARHGHAGWHRAAADHQAAGGGQRRSRAYCPPDLVSDQPQRIRGRGRRDRCGLEGNAGTKFSALDAALYRRSGRYQGQGRDRGHRLCARGSRGPRRGDTTPAYFDSDILAARNWLSVFMEIDCLWPRGTQRDARGEAGRLGLHPEAAIGATALDTAADIAAAFRLQVPVTRPAAATTLASRLNL